MKKYSAIVLVLMFINFSEAQVGINTINPHASAELDVTSTTKGLLLPRLTTTAINNLTATASEGLVVFNTTTKQYWGFNGASWQVFTTATAPTGVAQITTFAYWEFGTLPGGTNNFGFSPFAGFVSQITNANLERGVGIGTTGAAASSSWGGTDFNTSANTVAAAVAVSEFFTVILTLPATAIFSFTKISAYNIRRSGTGPASFQWQYSINGGTFTDIGSAVNAGAVTSATGNPMPEVTLSSITALQNLPTTSTTVAFRMVIYGATNAGGTFYLNNLITTGNDLEIIGTYQ